MSSFNVPCVVCLFRCFFVGLVHACSCCVAVCNNVVSGLYWLLVKRFDDWRKNGAVCNVLTTGVKTVLYVTF